jgi:hypothetical protein
MKTAIIKTEPPAIFKPVSIQFTFETQQELDTFGALFNSSAIMDVVRDCVHYDLSLYQLFVEAGADLNFFQSGFYRTFGKGR